MTLTGLQPLSGRPALQAVTKQWLAWDVNMRPIHWHNIGVFTADDGKADNPRGAVARAQMRWPWRCGRDNAGSSRRHCTTCSVGPEQCPAPVAVAGQCCGDPRSPATSSRRRHGASVSITVCDNMIGGYRDLSLGPIIPSVSSLLCVWCLLKVCEHIEERRKAEGKVA